MKNLTALFKKFKLRQIVTVFLAGVLLLVSTACNNGDVRGARPQNPPVQMGGNNNPHKGGGDNYTRYKMTTDPGAKAASNQRNRADAQLVAPQLIAANTVDTPSRVDSSASDILYPGSGASETSSPGIGPRGQRELQEQTQRFPKQRQPVLDRSNPDAKILERVGEEFKDASAFLKDTTDSALSRPELAPNPAERDY